MPLAARSSRWPPDAPDRRSGRGWPPNRPGGCLRRSWTGVRPDRSQPAPLASRPLAGGQLLPGRLTSGEDRAAVRLHASLGLARGRAARLEAGDGNTSGPNHGGARRHRWRDRHRRLAGAARNRAGFRAAGRRGALRGPPVRRVASPEEAPASSVRPCRCCTVPSPARRAGPAGRRQRPRGDRRDRRRGGAGEGRARRRRGDQPDPEERALRRRLRRIPAIPSSWASWPAPASRR